MNRILFLAQHVSKQNVQFEFRRINKPILVPSRLPSGAVVKVNGETMIDVDFTKPQRIDDWNLYGYVPATRYVFECLDGRLAYIVVDDCEYKVDAFQLEDDRAQPMIQYIVDERTCDQAARIEFKYDRAIEWINAHVLHKGLVFTTSDGWMKRHT